MYSDGIFLSIESATSRIQNGYLPYSLQQSLLIVIHLFKMNFKYG